MKISDDVQKADLLNRTFAAKFTDPGVSFFPDVPFTIDATLTNFHVSEDVVRRLLQELVASKACGPDVKCPYSSRVCG